MEYLFQKVSYLKGLADFDDFDDCWDEEGCHCYKDKDEDDFEDEDED